MAYRALLHKSASEVFAFITETVAILERHTSHTLIRLRMDGGSEYDNALFRDWCAKNGVVHELTSWDSPQQDGPGERLNRTVWDRVRPVMKECGFPIVPYLAHAFQYATHIRNLAPSKGRDMTPHFAMFGTNIDASRLGVLLHGFSSLGVLHGFSSRLACETEAISVCYIICVSILGSSAWAIFYYHSAV